MLPCTEETLHAWSFITHSQPDCSKILASIQEFVQKAFKDSRKIPTTTGTLHESLNGGRA